MSDGNAFRRRLYERYASTHAARDGDGAAREAGRRPYLNRLIRRAFPSDLTARIVDLGCGEGALLRALAAHGYRDARGVDTSPEQVAAAVARGSQVVCGDLLETLRAMPDASQDVVVAFDVLEHFKKDEVLELGDHVHRVLRRDGRFIVHVPNGSALLGAPTFFSDLTHEICFTPHSMRQLMSVIGFSDVRIEEDAPTVHGVKSGARWLLWQALRQGVRFAQAVETGVWSGGVYSQNLLAIATK